MNYANPFSKSSYASLFKENPSTLTSFLSQNHSIRSSNKSIPSRQSYTPQQLLKQTELLSPRQKIVTLHDDKRSKHKTNERVKYVSEHTSMPYLYISKKRHEIRIPILPKLSPEPKIEVSRLPYINIMTEPTAAIEEHSDEGQSLQDQSMEDSQKLLNKSKSFLQVSQISQNQDELSNSKISLKSRFRQAVQKSFRSPPRKSLFNILISHEFNTFHEKERKSLQVKFEPGNQVLAAKLEFGVKNKVKKQKCLKAVDINKKVRFINMEQFQISTKAFQRKINLIHCTSSRNLVNFEQFSLLKNSKKNLVMTSQRSSVQQKPVVEVSPRVENKVKEKFNITITCEDVHQFTYQFFKPKHMKEEQTEEVPVVAQSTSPKTSSPIVPLALLASSKRLPSGTPKKMDFNQSFINMKTKRMSRLSFQQLSVQDESNDKQDQKNDYSKPGLFVRVYYQNKLYKLMQKTNYTKDNLQEIEINFRPKIAQPSSSSIVTTIYTVMSTSEQGVRQRKVTNEGFADRSQFLGIKFPKYFLEYPNNNFDYDEETSSYGSQSSDDSDSEKSLDKLLESPLNPNKPQARNKKSQQKKKTIIQLSSSITTQTIFFNDPPIDQKQLSTGTLILIKKLRKTLQIPIFLQPILSTLEQNSKNKLLTFDASVCENFIGEPMKDLSQEAFQNLIPFQKNKTLIKIVYQALEIKYSVILTGRFLSQTRMIDVEHQDPQPSNIILEKQESRQDKFELQFQPQTISNKVIMKVSNKDSVHDSQNKNQQLTSLKSKYTSQRNLTKQSSLQVNQPQLLNRRTMNSGGEVSNQTLQQSNQQNSNLFTQTSTVLITKPTQTSQQSVFRVMSSKHIDLNSSQQDLSSSFHSSQNDESPKSGKNYKTQNSQRQPSGSQNEQQVSNRKSPSQHETSQRVINDQHNKFLHFQEIHNPLSMYMQSLRMRTHIKESQRRQKLDQIHLVNLAIYDHNFTEFLDNIQSIPEMQLGEQFEKGNTFLIVAAQCGCYEIVHELIKRGVDINIQNDDGNTAVHMALAFGHYKIADMLMEAGGSTHILNKKGQNAWCML